MTPTMRAALRALRDCGTIRATGHPGYMGLAASGYAVATRRHNPFLGWLVDYRLTDAGRDEATRLPPLPGDLL